MMLKKVIHVVDDDPAMRDSLTFMLEAADYAVDTYDSAYALLAKIEGLSPGVIITDVRMPGMNGLELVTKLKELGCGLPVVVLTGHADVALAVEAMKAGVVDFIEKPFDDNALLGAIEIALARGVDQSGRDAERQEIEARVSQLTQREAEVFEAIVTGHSNKVTAIKLGISPRTVEIYRANVMEKMRAKSLSELVRMSMQR